MNEDKQIILMRAEKDWKKLLDEKDSKVDCSGQKLVQHDNYMKLSSKQNVKISSNNLVSDSDDPLQTLVDLLVD